MDRKSFTYALYASVIAVLLTLTGIFTSFENTVVIAGLLNLSTVILVLMVGGASYVNAWRVRDQANTTGIMVGAVSGVIVAAALAALVLVSTLVDLRFVFPNIRDLGSTTLTFGQADLGSGLLALLVFGVAVGSVMGLLLAIPDRLRNILIISTTLTALIGLLQNQINNIVTPPYALLMVAAFALAYFANYRFIANTGVAVRMLIGLSIGLVLGVLAALVVSGGTTAIGGINIFPYEPTTPLMWGTLILVIGSAGALGSLAVSSSRTGNSAMLYFMIALLVLAVINWQRQMTFLAAVITFLLVSVPLWFAPYLTLRAEERFTRISRLEKRTTSRLTGAFALILLLIAPLFLGQYITSVFDLVGLYIIMGIGLNVMVGYAGLLDLGFVAAFAIGAYSLGLLTTPSLITCGGVAPDQITPDNVAALCTGVMTFWQAWPLAALTAGLTGVLLGIPVMRLRGDYLAIVTLGFGEIINRITLSSTFQPLLGGAQGISPIPSPVIDLRGLNPDWYFRFDNAVSVYYLILFSVLLVAFVVLRLSVTRLGRAWRSIRADEDVAEAMGIHLVRSKLLAFGISRALAGLGGAIFAAWLQGIFPNSFTLLVSINVLSLIIIGGLGSIPGVVVGSMILIGLPEVLREFQDYRLLAFGVLLVVTMLLRPTGLIPPPVRRLAEEAMAHRAEKQAAAEISRGGSRP
jgi:ABC-type branched-subunit amino acid transport system permease subunit